jgi:hypothetical protein
MILPFKTHQNGNPTHFVEKIWRSLMLIDTKDYSDYWQYFFNCHEKGFDVFQEKNYIPKRHTIREDKNNRWKPGTMIDFFINARQKDMFRFAPRIPVVSVQKIDINYNPGGGVNVFIDNRFFHYQTSWGLAWDDETKKAMLMLAKNDGFDSVDDFFAWFNKDFSGKIIHWTDLSYDGMYCAEGHPRYEPNNQIIESSKLKQ